MKHFSDLSEAEVNVMIHRCQLAAIAYARQIGMSGLSEGCSHDLYRAIHNAIRHEWKIAKAWKLAGEQITYL